jgi:hypothetical protein
MTNAPGETKRDRRELSRQERKQRIDASRRSQQIQRRLLIGFGILVLVGIVGLVVWMAMGSRESIGRSVPLEGATHVDEGSLITYQSVPPTSGAHYPVTAPYGVSDRPIEPGYFVHNLEHGGIVVLYNCDPACPDIVTSLRQAFVDLPRSKLFNRVKLVVTPYSAMPHKIAYLAWGRVDEEDTYDYDKLLKFYNAYVDKGPEQAL